MNMNVLPKENKYLKKLNPENGENEYIEAR
jgi:hypothetical protein